MKGLRKFNKFRQLQFGGGGGAYGKGTTCARSLYPQPEEPIQNTGIYDKPSLLTCPRAKFVIMQVSIFLFVVLLLLGDSRDNNSCNNILLLCHANAVDGQ